MSGNVITFNASTNWICPANVTSVDYLVIGGGGGGGCIGGGGGAGGFRTGTSFPVTAGNVYAITVGAGGTGALPYPSAGNQYVPGSSGTSSIFSSITSAGGGYAGSYNYGP